MNRKNLEDFAPIILEAIRDGGQFVFYPSGISMLPTIDGGKDCVVLAEPNRLKKYDLILYKRNNGQYVLHRIMKINNGKYTLCGDNQLYFEYNIESNLIIAKAVEIRKQNGHVLDYKQIKSGMLMLSCKRFLKKAVGKIKRIIKG